MRRGIDPTTHRPINDNPAAIASDTTNQDQIITKTISFSNNSSSKEDDQYHDHPVEMLIKEESSPVRERMLIKEENSPVQERMRIKEESSSVRERCPDLNLELRISPPYQNQEAFRTGGRGNGGGGRTVCFVCSIGIHNSKDCSCGETESSGAGYDFLGLKSGVLDYRSLEMK